MKYAQFLVAISVSTFGLNVYTCSGMSLTLLRPLKVDSFQLHVTPIGHLEARVKSFLSFLIFCMCAYIDNIECCIAIRRTLSDG